ncbi:hypothetical protein D3C79_747480 [compost metagenome]
MGTQNTAFFQHQADQFVLHTVLDFGSQASAANEITLSGIPGDAPAQVGGERSVSFVDVLAVEVHPGFKAQRIAGTKTAGGDTGTDQIVEESRGLVAWQNDLQAVFAGVAGASDEPVTFGHTLERFQFTDQGCTRGADQRRNFPPGIRTLNGEDGQIRS